jgi:septation ring formation regulator EzrA
MLQYKTALKAVSHDRIAELESQLEQRDIRIRELRADVDKANVLISTLRERSTRCEQQVAIW